MIIMNERMSNLYNTISSGNSTNDDHAFCDSGHMSMTMYMDGFHSSWWHNNNNHNDTNTTQLPCLLYLVPTWLLDDQGRFQGAWVFSFLLALLLEICSALRGRVQLLRHQPSVKHVLTSLLYALQAVLGNLLMFMAMTFSFELLGAAVAGLAVGNLLLFRYHDFDRRQRRRPRPEGRGSTSTTTSTGLSPVPQTQQMSGRGE